MEVGRVLKLIESKEHYDTTALCCGNGSGSDLDPTSEVWVLEVGIVCAYLGMIIDYFQVI